MRTNLKTYFRAILYHPQENDQEGRINPTLLNMFRTLPEIHKKQWNTKVNKMAQAHECTNKKTTGCCPFFLLSPRFMTNLQRSYAPRVQIYFPIWNCKKANKGDKDSQERIISTCNV